MTVQAQDFSQSKIIISTEDCRTSLVLNFDDIRLRRGFITSVLDGASTSWSPSFSIASICLDCFREYSYGTILGPDDLLRCLSADIVDEDIMFV